MKQDENGLRYDGVAKAFHWGMAALILGTLALGWAMQDIFHGPFSVKLHGIHKSLGVCVLTLVALRLIWRLISPAPPLPEHMKPYERLLAHLSHWGLYGFMFGVPVIGLLMSQAAGFPVNVFGWFIIPTFIQPDRELMKQLENLHGLAAYTMLGIIGLHAAAALIHYFYYKDRVLQRMLPFAKGDA